MTTSLRVKAAAVLAVLILLPTAQAAPPAPPSGAAPPGTSPDWPALAAPRKPMSAANDSVVIESVADPTTLDPAVAYDDSSGAVVQAVYETLVTYNRSSTNEFVPLLATTVPTVANGGISNGNMTYTFHIRNGIRFHSGDALDADDVVYSFRRVLTIDDPSGPAWMLDQVLNTSSVSKVDNFTVRFDLTRPYGAFISILAYTVGSIVSQQTVDANGGLVYHTINTWMLTHEDGTGPFVLDSWNAGSNLTLVRNAGYWDAASAAQVGSVVTRFGSNFSAWRAALLNGSADIIPVPNANRTELSGLAANASLHLNTSQGPSTWIVAAGALNQAIDTANRSQLGALTYPDNVPSDFFADVEMRKAFSLAYDYADYIANVTLNTGVRMSGIIPRGMYGYHPGLGVAQFNLALAQSTYNGTRWATNASYNPGGRAGGFSLTCAYNSGNLARQKACLILQRGAEQLGPNIHVNVVGYAWSTYLSLTLFTASGGPGPVPVFFVGWGPDYADPDDYATPFLHSLSTYPRYTGFSNASLDALIDAAGAMPNSPERLTLYDQIQLSAIREADYLLLTEGTSFHVQSDSLRGWYYNPMLSQADLGGRLAGLYWGPPPDRTPPTVSAGGDLVAVVGRLVSFNGSVSDDDPAFPAGGSVEWNFSYNGSWVNLAGERATFVFFVVGAYVVTLTATDAAGNVGSDTITLLIVPDTFPPSVNAGGDVSITAGVNWSFNGFATDDDPDFATTGRTGWRFDYNGSALEFSGATLSFTFWAVGVYPLTFFAADASGNTATDVRLVTVVAPDTEAPSIYAGPDASITAGDAAFLNGTAFDNDPAFPEGAQFWWTFSYGGAAINLSGLSVSFLFSIPGNYTVNFTVRDGWGNEAVDSLALTVLARDAEPPAVLAPQGFAVAVGAFARFNASATDNDPRFVADGNYTWSFLENGSLHRLYGPETGYTFAAPGDYVVSLLVRDASGNAAAPTAFVVHVYLPDTTPPTVSAGADILVEVGVAVNFQADATDAGKALHNDSLFSWTFIYEGKVTVLHGEAASFTFAVSGVYNVTLLVLDEAGNAATDHVVVTVKARPPPNPGPTTTGEVGLWLLVAIGIAGVAGGAAVGVVANRRRKRPE